MNCTEENKNSQIEKVLEKWGKYGVYSRSGLYPKNLSQGSQSETKLPANEVLERLVSLELERIHQRDFKNHYIKINDK